MAKLSLLDAFGLDASGSLRPNAHLAKALPEFGKLRDTPLDQVQLASGKVNLLFHEPIALALPGLSLTIGAGAGGHICIITSSQHSAFGSDPFKSIKVESNEVYLELGLELSTSGGIAIQENPLAFGFSATHGLNTTISRRFFRSDAGAFLTFGQALAQTLRSFVIPQTREDLDGLDPDIVILVGGTGELKLSSSFGIATPVRQLAATSPIAGSMLEVNALASFTAAFSLTLAGGYQTRLRRLTAQVIELGIYKAESHTLAIQVAANAGLKAGVGTFDLASKFIGALSLHPIVDLQEFEKALPGEDAAARGLQMAAFESDLRASISTNIALNLTDGVSSLRGDQSVLTFEVDLTAAPAASAALLSALHGNFTDFVEGAPGITQTCNTFTQTSLVKQKLTVNLLGLVNFISIGKLARISEIKRGADGEITLVSDTADANRLDALLLNAAGNRKRLQAMLSEDFLFQATFKAIDLRVLPPEFIAKQTFFEINGHTDKTRMKDLLDVCRVMGLLTPDQESSRLQNGNKDFGRTTFWLQTTYSNISVDCIFFAADGTVRTQEEFETQGRLALAQLLVDDEGQEFRKLITDTGPRGTSIWHGMKKTGAIGKFNSLFGLPLDVEDPRVNAAGSDFLCITSWAAAMNKLANTIVDIRTLLKEEVRFDSDRLSAIRERLRERMAEVVKHSSEHFGEPLGLVMVYLSSRQSAGARIIATGASIPTLTNTITPQANKP